MEQKKEEPKKVEFVIELFPEQKKRDDWERKKAEARVNRKRPKRRLIGQQTHCLTCGKPLRPNNSRQHVLYCCKTCRLKRHNRKRG